MKPDLDKESPLSSLQHFLGNLSHQLSELESKLGKQDRELAALKKDHNKSIDSVSNQVLAKTDHKLNHLESAHKQSLEQTNAQLSSLKTTVTELEEQLTSLKANPTVPIGFVYTQLPSQKEPEILWPGTKWLNVTDTYGSAFFRAEGDRSGLFGTVQPANDHRVVRVETVEADPSTGKAANIKSTTVTVDSEPRESRTDDAARDGSRGSGGGSGDGDDDRQKKDNTETESETDAEDGSGDDGGGTTATDWMYTGDWANRSEKHHHHYYLRLVTTTGEIRPRNMAVRVWIRQK